MQQSEPSGKIRSVSPTGEPDPSQWVDLHGDVLFRFALLRVKDQHVAEDLVQDTFLSALEALGRFQGGSSVRTWLIGILKHKIIDHFRKNAKVISSGDINPSGEESENLLFDEKGRWKEPPLDWHVTPSTMLEEKELRHALQNCLDGLSTMFRNVFSMREIDGMKSEEICKVLNISPTNLWVMLHRSRNKLRKCLETTWFHGDRERTGD